MKDQIKKEQEIKNFVFHPTTLAEAGYDGAKGLTGLRIGPQALIDYSKLGTVFLDQKDFNQPKNLKKYENIYETKNDKRK